MLIIGYDYYNLKKINTIAPDATAFGFRGGPPKIMLQCTFDGKASNIRELESKAIKVLKRMKEVSLEDGDGFSYSNYSSDGG
jgi:hypothetical protein